MNVRRFSYIKQRKDVRFYKISVKRKNYKCHTSNGLLRKSVDLRLKNNIQKNI